MIYIEYIHIKFLLLSFLLKVNVIAKDIEVTVAEIWINVEIFS